MRLSRPAHIVRHFAKESFHEATAEPGPSSSQGRVWAQRIGHTRSRRRPRSP